DIADRAEVSVVARIRVVRVHAAACRIAGIVRAWIVVLADQRTAPRAGSLDADIGSRAEVSVVATIRVVRAHAPACRIAGIVRAWIVVLADQRTAPRAGSLDA